MKDFAIIFAAQYVYILLLAVQSLNINHGKQVAAAMTSLMLGCFGYHLTATIAMHKGEEFGFVWLGYVLAGPCGAVTGMGLFKRTRKKADA